MISKEAEQLKSFFVENDFKAIFTEDGFEAYMEECKRNGIDEIEVERFGKSMDSLIIYIPGGAYSGEPMEGHFKLAERLSEKAEVLFMRHPALPEHTVTDVFDDLLEIYEEKRSEFKNVYLMGDSSGGGLALALAEAAKEKPSKVILISPWLDVSLSDPEIEDKEDPILEPYGLRRIGKMWAGELSLADYRVSPIYGSLDGLDITIFCGTDELLYTDILKLKDRCDIHVAEGMFHAYPVFDVPEAEDTIKEILELL